MDKYLLEEKFKDFVLSSQYPCLGAKSAVNNKSFQIGRYSELGTADSAEALARDLRKFVSERGAIKSKFTTFVAIFEGPISIPEKAFEDLLWKQLSLLISQDDQAWNDTVSSNPEDNNFGFSFDGTAFFIVGLHNKSSRFSRRFAYPTLVFNPHDQFEFLKKSGKYSKMQSMIRKRDSTLQGAINPMAADFGTISEARQYSGRAVSEDWKCPFLHKQNK
ncbi:MAG: guanitoxin biosynthesis heme-dependent pre-guanitoxin N-hydroxylase GntA [Cyclobacteriaceae bacterium]